MLLTTLAAPRCIMPLPWAMMGWSWSCGQRVQMWTLLIPTDGQVTTRVHGTYIRMRQVHAYTAGTLVYSRFGACVMDAVTGTRHG